MTYLKGKPYFDIQKINQERVHVHFTCIILRGHLRYFKTFQNYLLVRKQSMMFRLGSGGEVVASPSASHWKCRMFRKGLVVPERLDGKIR